MDKCFTKMPLTGCYLPQCLGCCHHSGFIIVKNNVWTLIPANKSADGLSNLDELEPLRNSINSRCWCWHHSLLSVNLLLAYLLHLYKSRKAYGDTSISFQFNWTFLNIINAMWRFRALSTHTVVWNVFQCGDVVGGFWSRCLIGECSKTRLGHTH